MNAGLVKVLSCFMVLALGCWQSFSLAAPSADDCGSLDAVEEGAGSIDFSYVANFDTAVLTCEPGRLQLGSSYAVCSDGEWTSPGSCVAITSNSTCQQIPKRPENGYFELKGTNTDADKDNDLILDIICYPGYKLNSRYQKVIACNGKTGQWSTLPNDICQLANVGNSCGQPPKVGLGKVASGSSLIGAFRPVLCDFFYEIQGDNFVACTTSGLWSQAGTCVPTKYYGSADQGRNFGSRRGEDQTILAENAGVTITKPVLAAIFGILGIFLNFI